MEDPEEREQDNPGEIEQVRMKKGEKSGGRQGRSETTAGS
jgi:hypothetical protein